jgi:heme-degrading monooxygenase HmoA
VIRVLVGYKVKTDIDILPILLQIRSSEMSYPGFISSENLQSEDDRSTIFTMSTWQQKSDWKAWESSKIRKSLSSQLEGKLQDVPKESIYTIMPTVGWLLR